MILAIDPGTTHSGYVVCEDSIHRGGQDVVLEHGVMSNEEALDILFEKDGITGVVIEKFVSRYQRLGQDSVDTIEWQGMFRIASSARMFVQARMIPRADVVKALGCCGGSGDPAVRMALIDRFGGKAKAIGLKKTPGPLYGIKSHEWAALALAVTYSMKMSEEARGDC